MINLNTKKNKNSSLLTAKVAVTASTFFQGYVTLEKGD